ncbi:hypothetical protein N7491_008134 [Penicillium cf. griseofulvum]|uniref:Uncharacterized protein n=1 Tax=Penicillium cf. griseofulvum TaxID=2972120 RepID=A0A9W9J3A6_9EURO|nr:hypothetical protein N7472_008837 [Penicillium cf. griseofulvum]KAJ5427692.1 hypothetical protein N7491_008134 [Penicillium cf. griseofulvum]KAJ5431890.1 hypothetical protein N7445_008388 [Penicillium cf. griseofulvum]
MEIRIGESAAQELDLAPPGHLNSGQRNIFLSVFVKYCMSQTEGHTRSVPLSPPPLNSLQIEFPSFPPFLNLNLSKTFPQQLILLSICSILLDQEIFGIFNLRGCRDIVAYPYVLDSRWDPSPQIQWLSDRCIPRNTLDSAIPSPDLRLG